MQLRNLLRPYYLFRPRQLFVRLRRATRAAPTESQRAAMPWGTPFEIDPRDHIGRAVWHNGLYDLLVSEVLWRLASPGALAVDVGANIGCMTSLLASRVGPSGRVVALEPHPKVRDHLLRNVALFSTSRETAPVTVVAAAAGEHPGTAELVMDEQFDENAGTAHILDGTATSDAHRRAIQVDVVTLDGILADAPVELMKVDVEGFEASVFRGARGLLQARRVKHIVYEDNVGAESAVHAQLEAHGYRVFALGWRVLGPIVGPRTRQLARPDEAPSYLATTAPEEAVERLARRGWQVLHPHRAPSRGVAQH